MFLYIETQKKELSDSLVKIGQDHIFTKFQNKPAEGKRKKHENGYISSNNNDSFVWIQTLLPFPAGVRGRRFRKYKRSWCCCQTIFRLGRPIVPLTSVPLVSTTRCSQSQRIFSTRPECFAIECSPCRSTDSVVYWFGIGSISCNSHFVAPFIVATVIVDWLPSSSDCRRQVTAAVRWLQSSKWMPFAVAAIVVFKWVLSSRCQTTAAVQVTALKSTRREVAHIPHVKLKSSIFMPRGNPNILHNWRCRSRLYGQLR